MSTSRKHSAILSEIKELQKILDTIPAEDVIDRYAFQQRLASAQSELNNTVLATRAAENLKLTFRGLPVSGSHGIAADFAGKASSAFADAFSAILAGLNNTLKYMGPIPDRSRNALLITGTAVGSFGFEYELPIDNGDLFVDRIGADEAVESFKALLKVSVHGSDDDMLDLVEVIHPRAIRKVADFLKILSHNGAWCGIEFRHDYFKFADIDQLKESEKRLRSDSILTRDEAYFGEFQGVLPHSRNFEFRIADDGTIIRGKLDREIEDPDLLNREWLHKPMNVTFAVSQLGQGRPRFTLMDFDSLSNQL